MADSVSGRRRLLALKKIEDKVETDVHPSHQLEREALG